MLPRNREGSATYKSRVERLLSRAEIACEQLIEAMEALEKDEKSLKEGIAHALKLLQLIEKLHELESQWKCREQAPDLKVNIAVIRKYLDGVGR